MAREQFRSFMEREIPGIYNSRTSTLHTTEEYILENFGLRTINSGREAKESDVEACLDTFYLENLKATRDETITAARAFVLPDGKREAINYTCYDQHLARVLPEGFQVKITVLDLTKACGGLD